MDFLIVLACTAVFVYVFKHAICKAPIVFYVLALVLSAVYFATTYVDMPVGVKLALFTMMQKGTLATALFVVVMYIGVFRNVDFIRRRLMPARATLSIIACILILGHVFKYLAAYLPRFSAIPSIIQGGLVVAVICFVIMAVLGVTSVQRIKHSMHASTWVKLQKWAYVFFALVYAHAVVLLVPTALPGTAAYTSIIVYTAVFGLYAVLRVGKAALDRRHTADAENVDAEPDDAELNIGASDDPDAAVE